MRLNITRGILVLVFIFSALTVQGQISTPPAENYDAYIAAVYTNSGKDFIKPDSRRYAYFKELYLNRIRFVKNDAEKLSQDNSLLKLSSVALYDTYNKGLMRDATFDASRFNPFKYNLDFYSANKLIYWIDNSDYLLVITPQERK
ncbi:MAG: hypothetical protein ABJM06_01995 [Gilvibacter sp.]